MKSSENHNIVDESIKQQQLANELKLKVNRRSLSVYEKYVQKINSNLLNNEDSFSPTTSQYPIDSEDKSNETSATINVDTLSLEKKPSNRIKLASIFILLLVVVIGLIVLKTNSTHTQAKPFTTTDKLAFANDKSNNVVANTDNRAKQSSTAITSSKTLDTASTTAALAVTETITEKNPINLKVENNLVFEPQRLKANATISYNDFTKEAKNTLYRDDTY